MCYINAIAFSTNMLLYYGATPVLLDFFGRPCFPVRYVQWLHTTPTMIFMAAKISSFTTPQVSAAHHARPYVCRHGWPVRGPGCQSIDGLPPVCRFA